MYLVILIIDKRDDFILIETLNKNDIKSTKVASTGGFLNSGNTTLFIGIEEQRIPKLLDLVRSSCSRRESCEYIYSPYSYDHFTPISYNNCVKIEVGGAVAFIIKVEQYFRI